MGGRKREADLATEGAERRLAAILAADVVGYSRLMGMDEEGTRARFNAHVREIIEPSIGRHRGRVVNSAGDSFLVEFASVVRAVQCAVDIQNGMARRSANAPDDQRMDFRIGVNLGDVIVEGDDIHGDGVNIAARLEGLAEAGGICVSGDVYRQARGKIDVRFEDLGPQEVKNIDEPVHVFRVALNTETPAVPQHTAAEPVRTLSDGPSIAVLPFDNMSRDAEQEYFADGITEDIIISLSKVSGLFVIARNSSFTYKRKAAKVQQIAEDLGVTHVLEGSVRKAGERVRVSAQLIDCATGGHLWAERFDRDLTDIFAVQDEVTHEIVAALALTLTPSERERLDRRGTDSIEAYDFFLRGRELWRRLTKETNAQAQILLRRAIELDPRFAHAYALLVQVHIQEYSNRWGGPSSQPLKEACDLAQQAVALDDSDPSAHVALGDVYLWMMRRHDEAVAECRRAIELDPNDPDGYLSLGWALDYAGQSQEAIEHFHRAMQLDPHYPDQYLHMLAHAHFQLGQYDEAVTLLKRRIVLDPNTDMSRVLLAAVHGHQGHIAEARVLWTEVFELNPEYSLEYRRQILPYKNPADFDHIVDGLRKAGLPE